MNKGISKLSLTGRGRYSMNIATTAPTSAIRGETNRQPARNAKKTPATEPSRLLSLLKGNGVLEKRLPKIEAELSPKANMAMAA